MTQTDTRESPGGRIVALTVLGLVLLVGAAYAAAYAFAGDKLPRGTSVAGIDLGGSEPDAAAAKLTKEFAGRATVKATVDGKATKLTADELGLSVDADASVEAAGGGRSWSPGRLWDYYTGGDDLDPVLVRDTTAFAEALRELDAEFGTPPREGDVTFEGGQVHKVIGQTGMQVDRTTAESELEDAYVSGGTAELTLATAQPEVSEADVQAALDEFGNAAVSGPVTLVLDKTQVKLEPADYAPALAMTPEDGLLVPDLDEAKLEQLVRAKITGTAGAPVDATVKLVGGKPQVVPSKPGIVFASGDIAATFLEVVVKPAGQRTLAVKATVQEPAFTTADAEKLQIKEKVSSFVTYYPHEDYRNTNIGRAAQLVNGTVLKPGETFSLNDTVGERTEANGFTTGYIISDGILRRDLGGGVSQMATTTFNAAYFAGLKDVEHKAHSFYIDRYPVGREATVAWGAVDLKFTNDTPYGVLIQANVVPSNYSRKGVVTVSMWSTKFWDITSKTGSRYAFTTPKTRTMTGDDCVPNKGFGGFDIDVWRYFRKPGSAELVRTEKMHTTYIPSDTVICQEEPTRTPPPTPPGDDGE